MALQIGIVGLPNVGKSTLFNALTKSHAAEAANYPFCTIDPNVGIVEVPDTRLTQLASLYGSEKIIPTAIEFVDIAGLVKGASAGEGLGNKFLAHIREVDAICHVVRDFVNDDIQHVSGGPNPKDDIGVIETELILADLATVDRKRGDAERKTKSGDKKAMRAVELIDAVKAALEDGKPAYSVPLPDDAEERTIIRDLSLLTSKPLIYAVNVAEDALAAFDVAAFRTRADLPANANIVPVSAKIESELIDLDDDEAQVFLEELGLTESSLNRLIREAYAVLDLITYFTAGPKEARAWTIRRGTKAPGAAGVIHTDFERGFIRAETIAWDRLVEAGSEAAAKEKGWMRAEGKEYVVSDGDTMHFRFNV